MTSPSMSTTVGELGDVRQPESLDERLDRLFGPSDPATDAWIEASIAQYRDAQVVVLGGAR